MSFTAKVITTAEWGAKPAITDFSRTSPRYVIVHHTDNQNPPDDFSERKIEGAMRLARSIQRSHMDDNGWSDSGHNFLNTTGGFILEGRHGSLAAVKQGFCIRSTHAKQDPGKLANGNRSPGIENEGNFMTFQMSQLQWDSLVNLCVSLCDSCGISPTNTKGHRDFSDTDCPGDWLYGQLSYLRQKVANKLGLKFTNEELDNNSQITELKLGSTGLGVIKLQQTLLARGFSPGAIDGDFGENTQEAVIRFQKSVGLVSDGRVGVRTRTALGI